MQYFKEKTSMKDKKIFPIIVGVMTMLLIGFVLSQSILATLILLDWPVSRFLNNYPVVLCILAGLIQGLFEEGGRYLAFSKVLKKQTEYRTSLLYGLGHGGVEFLYTIAVTLTSSLALSAMGVELGVRFMLFGAQIAFSVLVFSAVINERKRYLFWIAFLVHAAIDAFSLAVAREYIDVSIANQNIIYVLVSITLIVFAIFTYRTYPRRV